MRVKKIFSMFLAGVTTLSLLAGCSSSTTSEPQATETQAKETESTGSKVLGS